MYRTTAKFLVHHLSFKKFSSGVLPGTPVLFWYLVPVQYWYWCSLFGRKRGLVLLVLLYILFFLCYVIFNADTKLDGLREQLGQTEAACRALTESKELEEVIQKQSSSISYMLMIIFAAVALMGYLVYGRLNQIEKKHFV